MPEGKEELMNKKTTTNRGFNKLDFYDSNGKSCCIQQSSAADEPKIWLGIDNPKLIVFENENMGSYYEIDMPKQFRVTTRMHLNVEKAKELIQRLQYFVEKGTI